MRSVLLALAAAAAVAPLAAAQADPPAQLHIALGGPNAMRVSWKTMNTTASVCAYGTSPTSLTSSVPGSAKQYIPGFGWHHAAKLSNLAPSTKYYYTCGSGGSNMSPVKSFVSAPPVGSTAPFSAIVFGDMGYEDSTQRPMVLSGIGGLYANWSATLSYQLMTGIVQRQQADLVLHVGDIGYSDDSFAHDPIEFTYEAAYDGYMSWLEPIASTLPYQVAAGNHESECHDPSCILDLDKYGNYLRNFSAYNARWAMPSAESGGVENMWYSFDYGNAHFTVLDTSTDWPGAPEGETGDSGFAFLPAGHFAPDGAFQAWLEADLAAARSNPNITWIIASGHRPYESLGNFTDFLVPLFAKYKVDVYFAGHSHSYSRFNSTAYGDGTTHVVVGGAGCEEMPFPSDQFGSLSSLQARGTDAPRACVEWCSRSATRAAFAEHKDGMDPCALCGLGAPVLGGMAKDTAGASGASLEAPSGSLGATPVYFTDLYALGKLDISGKTLKWSLLRAPDGLVLDSFTLQK